MKMARASFKRDMKTEFGTYFIAKRASTPSFKPALDAIQMEDMSTSTPCNT